MRPRWSGRRRIGLALLAGLLVVSALAMLARAEAGAVAATLTLITAAGVLALRAPAPSPETPEDVDAADLLTSSAVYGGDIEPSPGCVLVPVRNPHLLAHLTAALQGPRDREIVVMTVRLVGSDAVEQAESTAPTPAERLLFSRVLALSERYSRHARLAIVPARDVAEAVIGTAIRLHASELYAGESATV